MLVQMSDTVERQLPGQCGRPVSAGGGRRDVRGASLVPSHSASEQRTRHFVRAVNRTSAREEKRTPAHSVVSEWGMICAEQALGKSGWIRDLVVLLPSWLRLSLVNRGCEMEAATPNHFCAVLCRSQSTECLNLTFICHDCVVRYFCPSVQMRLTGQSG